MKKFIFILSCVVSLAGWCIPPDLTLMQSRYPDPSRMTQSERPYSNSVSMLLGATYPGQTEWTALVWVKSSIEFSSRAAFLHPFVMQFFSTRQGISNKEGGHQVLQNLLPYPETAILPLDENGQLVMQDVLLTTYDDGNIGDSSWQYGCYVVNIKTDTSLTLIVGGYEKRVSPSDEMQIFNIKCETADRSVVIMAENPQALIKMGIAENPLVEFHGNQIDQMSSYGGTADIDDVFSGFTGIRDDEYTLVVSQAKVNPDKTLTYRISALLHDVDYWQEPTTNKQPKWVTPEACFGTESRIGLSFAAMGGFPEDSKLEVYGAKVFDKWLDDSFISTIRDQDVAEMKRRGLPMPEHNTDYWTIKYSTSSYTTVVTNDNIGVHYDDGNGTEGDFARNDTTYHRNLVMNVKNGAASTQPWVVGDITWEIEGDYERGETPNIFKVDTNGSYVVHGTDPTGITKKVMCNVTGTEKQYQHFINITKAPAYGYAKLANDTVIDALMGATTDGKLYNYSPWDKPSQYRKWTIKRLYARPISSTAGVQGHRAMCLLSPHCYASATHYGWWVGGTMTFVSEDNSITSVVKTTSSMTKLNDWALAHGFSKEEVDAAGCGDIVVGRFTGGTTVDPRLCPYFINPEIASNYFGNTTAVLGWECSQLRLGYGFPCIFNPNNGAFNSWKNPPVMDTLDSKISLGISTNEFWTGEVKPTGVLVGEPAYMIKTKRESLPYSDGFRMQEMYPGDSGLPEYLDLGGKLVLCSTHTSVAAGPSYSKGWKLLKAYIEDAGDEFKLIDLPPIEENNK